jgi:hypothetical protein
MHKKWRTLELAHTDAINMAVSGQDYGRESWNVKAEDSQRTEPKIMSRYDRSNHAPTQLILSSVKENIPSV